MNIYYSTLSQIGARLPEMLEEFSKFGADHIELMLDGGGWNCFETRMEELAVLLANRRLTYSVHTPVWDINLTSENAQARKAALEACQQSIVFAAKIGAAHVVLHPGFCYAPVFSKSVAKCRAVEAVEALCAFNEPYRTQLLVENVGNAETSLFTESEYLDFIRRFSGRVNAILDVGHAYLCGWDVPRVIRMLGSLLFAVHLHDNSGTKDEHRPIGEGTIPWENVFRALREGPADLRLILEYNIGVKSAQLAEGKTLLLEKMNGLVETLSENAGVRACSNRSST